MTNDTAIEHLPNVNCSYRCTGRHLGRCPVCDRVNRTPAVILTGCKHIACTNCRMCVGCAQLVTA